MSIEQDKTALTELSKVGEALLLFDAKHGLRTSNPKNGSPEEREIAAIAQQLTPSHVLSALRQLASIPAPVDGPNPTDSEMEYFKARLTRVEGCKDYHTYQRYELARNLKATGETGPALKSAAQRLHECAEIMDALLLIVDKNSEDRKLFEKRRAMDRESAAFTEKEAAKRSGGCGAAVLLVGLGLASLLSLFASN